MTVQNSVSREDTTLKSLLVTKAQNVAVLVVSETLRKVNVPIPEVALMPAGQLDYAVDNMIRLHLLGTVPVEMKEKFVEQVQIMSGQCTQIRAQILQGLADNDRALFEEKLEGFAVSDELIFSGAAAQLKTDFHLQLIHNETEVRLVSLGNGA